MTEENKYLDTLFQSKFSSFEAEPPASVWDNIHTELHGKQGGSINPVNLATLAALVLISGLLGFSIMKDAPNKSNNVVLGDQAIVIEDNQSAYPQMLAHETPEKEVTVTENKIKSQPSSNTGFSGRKEPAKNMVTSHSIQHGRYAETRYASSFQEETRLAKMKARRSFSIHASVQALNTDNIIVRNSKYHPRFAGFNDGERKYNRKANWQLGMLFTPMVSFYSQDSIANQRSYSFDVSARWIKNEFFIESGLGLSFSSDDGKYDIDYKRYLGSYDDVYNVIYDTVDGVIVPTYYTNEVNVYDTVSSYKVEKTRNQYTYLQVPVYIGFNKQVDRFGWFVKGGPVFSILINQNIPNPDPGNDRIVGLDQKMATRVNTYWQFAFSAGLNYQLSNNVSIAIEPTFRYYLNSQYERIYISTRHPYSIGLRTGLLFNF